ncbi:hypothetical protein F0562_029707 [Nyssa sinensis]|uniref:Uncharacterized protein n=1 Tax=Nyssa sinensis TaxID=561372 RepID=A0A5J5B664_9ASTE|nr:hypothetical protein F0562_029707 [Nyssa sinensis]
METVLHVLARKPLALVNEGQLGIKGRFISSSERALVVLEIVAEKAEKHQQKHEELEILCFVAGVGN